MRSHWVHVEHDFAAPVGRVFAQLAEHEDLGAVLGARIDRLNDGDTERNGVGSRRRLRIGPLPAFEETITAFVPDELIDYRITKGTPLRDHVGEMRFSALPDGGTHLDYRIRVATPVPGLALAVKAVLTQGIGKGLADLDARLAATG